MREIAYFAICETCFETIQRHNPVAGHVWIDLCGKAMNLCQIIGVFNPDGEDIRVLEKLGFCVSTETDSAGYIKLKGHSIIDGKHTFCAKDGNHDEMLEMSH